MEPLSIDGINRYSMDYLLAGAGRWMLVDLPLPIFGLLNPDVLTVISASCALIG